MVYKASETNILIECPTCNTVHAGLNEYVDIEYQEDGNMVARLSFRCPKDDRYVHVELDAIS